MKQFPVLQESAHEGQSTKRDCIHSYYRISFNGLIIKEGRYAHKQVAKEHLDAKYLPILALQNAGYFVEVKLWNETKKINKTEYTKI